MLTSGILNPQIAALLARVRHTTRLVISDRGFPLWPGVDTVEISFVDDVPTVLEVVRAVRAKWAAGKAWMAAEFRDANNVKTQATFAAELAGLELVYETQADFNQRVPGAIRINRTGGYDAIWKRHS